MKDLKLTALHNPKRDKASFQGTAGWYPYYAGYSPTFVRDAIRLAQSKTEIHCVLDPWNGSGTTTQVAHSAGLKTEGFDLNPAMVVVAKAKTLNRNVRPSIVSLLDEICSSASKRTNDADPDPLTLWFESSTATAFRQIEKSIYALLVNRHIYAPLNTPKAVDNVSALAAFFYLALFRTARHAVDNFIGSNPTWVRSAPSEIARIRIPRSKIIESFRREAREMEVSMDPRPDTGQASGSPRIRVADSSALPIADGLCQLVISSPPYCTRIDYAVKTRPELALLGLSERQVRMLRDGMLGTPTIADFPKESATNWGRRCTRVLADIYAHPSKASRSYYWKTYIQYFSGLYSSLSEVARVLENMGLCFLVVQDSYYKDIHIDLAGVCQEMAAGLGFTSICEEKFPLNRSMVQLNKAAQGYIKRRKGSESVLVWQRNRSE